MMTNERDRAKIADIGDDSEMRSLTLIQAWRGFILDKSASGKSQYTIRNYKNTWRKIEKFITENEKKDPEKIMLNMIVRSLWVRFFAWCQDTEFTPAGAVHGRKPIRLSAKTINNYYTDLSAFYTWAVKLELTRQHAVCLIDRPEYQRPVIEPLTESDVKSILAACDHTTTWKNGKTVSVRPTATRDRAICMMLVSTGIRASELVTSTRGDLDLEDGQLKVRGKSRGTSPKERIVHFGRKTRRALWRYLVEYPELEENQPLFPSHPGTDPAQMTRRCLCTLLKRLGDRAGIKNVYPHRFRHTFVVNYLINGGDSLALKMMLGHSSLKMVDHYVKLATSDLAAIQRTADPADNWNL